MQNNIDQIATRGCALIERVFDIDRCRQFIELLDQAITADHHAGSIRESRGTVVAARNVTEILPEVVDWWKEPPLLQLIRQVLGETIGLVRVLFFDKPKDRSWSLPFHKDMTIAVKNNRLPSNDFLKPTNKMGVDHVEAPTWLLEKMLTFRIHLDPVTKQNGPLCILPGSHLTGKETRHSHTDSELILCNAGDVLAMRPLLSHGSIHCTTGNTCNRRILHLEFSGQKELPDGFRWHQYFECD